MKAGAAKMLFARLIERLRAFKKDTGGAIAIIASLLLVPLVGATGFGIDYTRTVSVRMKLDSAASEATLAGLQAARLLLLETPTTSNDTLRAAFLSRTEEVFLARTPAQATDIVITNIWFDRIGETVTGKLSYNASVPTVFANLVNVPSLSVKGMAESTTPASAEPSTNGGEIIARERFDGVNTPLAMATGAYNNWLISGNVLEIGDQTTYWNPAQVPAPPGGNTRMAELDSFGNTAISKKVFLPVGRHNIRYYYINRMPHPVYEPIIVCGTKSSDIGWATLPASNSGFQTNRIGVYLDPALSETPPTQFSDGPNNMIDVCVSSSGKWIERSITVVTKSPGYFWLTFQGEGASDSFGGLITDIRVCRTACPGTVASTYPWAGGEVLFRDDIELPAGVWPADYFTQYTLNQSGVGTPQSGWSSIPAGWTTTPTNQVELMRTFINGQQTYVLPMDSMGGATSNRTISRRFLLAPGTYTIQWSYSVGDNLGVTGTWCNNGFSTVEAQVAQVNALRPASARPADTNRIGVYADYDYIFGHPTHAATLGATPQWNAWWGGPLPFGWNRIPSQRIDHCVHSSTPVQRSWPFHVLKSGYYWITFRAEGTSDGWGARLDNIRLLARSGPVPIGDNLWIPTLWPGAAWPGSQRYHANGDFDLTQQ